MRHALFTVRDGVAGRRAILLVLRSLGRRLPWRRSASSSPCCSSTSWAPPRAPTARTPRTSAIATSSITERRAIGSSGTAAPIEKYVGDAVMAVFGAPLARSDDAERAVRAALSILEGIAALNERDPGLDLQVRAAVCTGEAIVSVDAAPADAARDGRRGQHRGPAAVLCTAGRARGRGGDLPPHTPCVRLPGTGRLDAKGKRDPVPAWLVERSLVAPAERPTSTTPLVGRDREVLLIRTVWDRAVTAGSPHVVTVLGPAGIGQVAAGGGGRRPESRSGASAACGGGASPTRSRRRTARSGQISASGRGHLRERRRRRGPAEARDAGRAPSSPRARRPMRRATSR